ncbi:MAG: molybdopterin-dependent oxidoreductase [Thermodesulfovibrionales bacterium]
MKQEREKADEELADKGSVGRRAFLKGLGALGAAASLNVSYCAEAQATLSKETKGLEPQPIKGTVVPGAAPHNCGGRCVTKAYVENGVIKRIVTDERPDKNLIDGTGNDPQIRACSRCRSYRERLYRSDRVTYPLKQTKERGDLSGFVRVSWDQALTEIAEKMQKIKKQYGNKAFYFNYGTGDVGAGGYLGHVPRLLNKFGGYVPYRNDYSWPNIEFVSWFTFGYNYYWEYGNSRDNAMNAELLLLWSNSYADLIIGSNSTWYMTQAKEKGAKVIAVDPRQNDTVSTLADQWVPVVPGTDAALLLALMYVMIKEDLLDADFVKKYVHGFYDDPHPALYHDDVDAARYAVPAGASLSAYILGTDEYLVKKGINKATSVYPGTIHYNVNKTDPLYGKSVPIYGKVPKTPEWAEKITGVPAAAIRKLAREWATKKTTTYIGAGFQRQPEGEQAVWLIYIMGLITGNFGKTGTNIANPGSRGGGFPFILLTHGKLKYAPYGFTAIADDLEKDIYDATKLTAPKYTPSFYTKNAIPVFLWADLARNGGTGESEWNDGQIKRSKVGIKCMMNFAGNVLLNQHGDCNKLVDLLKDRSKMELIVVADQFMTPSARYADYLLPAAMNWEKEDATTTWVVGESVIFQNKAVEPPGECRHDYDICAGLAEKLGIGEAFTEGKKYEEWLKEAWKTALGEPIPYEKWKKDGVYTFPELPSHISFKEFREDPRKNALLTPSGKAEAYSQAMLEDYEARGYDNIDSRVTLSGQLHDGSNKGRFVYPIPMYIPLPEGRHADGSHPDPTGALSKGYRFQLLTPHPRYRVHSTHNINAYLNELYKKDEAGRPAHFKQAKGPLQTWAGNAHEPVWMNPGDAQGLGIGHGDIVKIFNDRGAVLASAHLTHRTMPGIVLLAQGSYYTPGKDGVDRGGNPNTLTSQRPSRICQADSLGANTLVSIMKVTA